MKNKVIDLFGSKIVTNIGVKYSELLEQFMTPFANEFEDTEYLEDIFEFAINAWNFGNMKQLLPKDENENITNYINEESDINVVLFNTMIDYKISNFKEYDNFIVDFELKEVQVGQDPILSVITQEKEAYLANMMDGLDNEDLHSPDDFEENYINRSAIIVKPKQPFIDWHNSLYPDSKIDEIDIDIYLVDDNINDLEKFLKKKFDKLFTMVLYDWHTNKKEWPQKRNYKMFKQWFRIEISETIYDLERKPILKSE